MSLNLYKITTPLVDIRDFMATYNRKDEDDIFSIFSLDGESGNSKIFRFTLGKEYTDGLLKKTDYIDCSPALLFSPRFVEKAEKEMGDEIKFYPCKVICQGKIYDWYAAKITYKYPLLDKEKTTYTVFAGGKSIVRIPVFRKDIEEYFFAAKDESSKVYWAVTEKFKVFCEENGMQIRFTNL